MIVCLGSSCTSITLSSLCNCCRLPSFHKLRSYATSSLLPERTHKETSKGLRQAFIGSCTGCRWTLTHAVFCAAGIVRPGSPKLQLSKFTVVDWMQSHA